MTAHADCTCEGQCHGAAHCICIWIYDEARCIVECSNGGGGVEIGNAVLKPAALDSQVRLEAKGAGLAEVGAFLARHCDVEGLMIPASDATRKVDLSEDYTTVRAVIERTGLVITSGDGS